MWNASSGRRVWRLPSLVPLGEIRGFLQEFLVEGGGSVARRLMRIPGPDPEMRVDCRGIAYGRTEVSQLLAFREYLSVRLPGRRRLIVKHGGSGQTGSCRTSCPYLALMEFPPPSVLAHVVDVHCHPTDTDIPDGFPDDLPIKICAMSAQTRDQPLVRDIAARGPDKVTPAFGAFISRQLSGW